MNIAICDDNVYMTTKLEELIDSCFSDKGAQYACEVYLSGEELLQALEKEPLKFQIYILDIEMKEIDGLRTAAVIRESDKNAIIIFVTSHEELMPEAFEVLAFHYLVKPIDEKKAIQVFSRAIRAMEEKKTIFKFIVRKKIHTLYFEQIAYFESYGRKIIVHEVSGKEHEYYGTLKDILAKVPDRLFAQVHNSYIVNMDKLRTVDGECVILDSGIEIGISKKHHTAFHNAYRNFVLQQINE